MPATIPEPGSPSRPEPGSPSRPEPGPPSRPEPVEGPALVDGAKPGSIVAIAAYARNRVIGNGPEIPWRISADWKRFRRITDGHVLIMGRKTYASIGRPLPGRHTIVITRDPVWRADGVITADGLDTAIELARVRHPESIIFIAGGGEIYRAAWDRTEFLDVTEVDAEPEGDITFPKITDSEWQEVFREPRDGFAWVGYRRVVA